MASKKNKTGVDHLKSNHEHLLVRTVDETIDEGHNVKLVFTDTNGAKGWVRISKVRYKKYFETQEDEKQHEPTTTTAA